MGKNNKISEQNKAYIAGIIDGEGCIHLGYNSNKQFYSALSVEMGNKIVPYYLKRKVGGNVTFRKRKDRKITMYCWSLSGNKSGKIINDIYKYLLLKKQEANLYLKFQSTIRNGNNQYKGFLTDKIKKRRFKLIRKLKKEKRNEKR